MDKECPYRAACPRFIQGKSNPGASLSPDHAALVTDLSAGTWLEQELKHAVADLERGGRHQYNIVTLPNGCGALYCEGTLCFGKIPAPAMLQLVNTLY